MTVSEQIAYTGSLTSSNLNFMSAAEVFDMAMEEATNLDFTQSQYKAFKLKYQKYLYFPEYGEDYGAYLPYGDATVASITNENGRYMVGNEIVQVQKITTYDQLQETGQAYYPKQQSFTQLQSTTQPKTVYAYKIALPGGFFDNKLKIGLNDYEFVEDWKKVGDGKKIRITFGRILKPRSGNIPKVYWHSEVSFRKKGFFGGWYNYKSTTTFKANIKYKDNTTQSFSMSASGVSSHDGYFDCKWKEITPASNYIILNKLTGTEEKSSYPKKLFYFEGYTADLTVTYRGMSQTLTFKNTEPELWGYTTTKDKPFD